MKKKICYIVSDIDTSHLIDANIRYLNPEKYEVTAIFLGSFVPKLHETLKAEGYSVKFFECRGKIDIIPLIFKISKVLGEIKPDLIHTHLFYAAIIGLTAAKLKGIKKRINTRHHSVEAHLYHPHAVYYDKYINALSTHIIAITDLVAKVLTEKENVSLDKIMVIHHGFDLKLFDEAYNTATNLKEKYNLNEDYPIIGVISRYIHWKGIQYIIPAFKQILIKYPNAKLVLANAVGSYQSEILKLLQEIPVDRYCIIKFEQEVFDLYKSFDIFVHVPIGKDYEAFGQVYIEPLAMGIPSVFTLSGVANDFIEDKINALVVPFNDSESITKAVFSILNDEKLKQNLIENGINSVKENFSVENMIKNLEVVYQNN